MNKEAISVTLKSMKEYFDRSTRVLEEADSGFAPKKEMFTAAQQVAHVAHTIEWFKSHGACDTVKPPRAPEVEGHDDELLASR